MEEISWDKLRKAMPQDGLLADKEWLWSPEPFPLSKGQKRQISGLGQPLRRFQQASDELYRLSAEGRRDPWIAQVLDQGKPGWMRELQRQQSDQRPRVIRPDLLLTEGGVAISELDSVPGGIGVLAWLSQLYEDAGYRVYGGREGMLEGFRSLLPEGGTILVSDESADYRPEMEWLAQQLGEDLSVARAEDWVPDGRDVYRFFECFDYEQIPAVRELAEAGRMTPPLKPHLEEKAWLALLHTPSLKRLWQDQLRGSHWKRLKEIIPYGWVVDPSDIAPHASLPKLNVFTWEEVGALSQRLRKLVLKISGFHKDAWGSRGVVIGHDVSAQEWQGALSRAIGDFGSQAWMMQEFAEAALVEHPFFDPRTRERKVMKGRVRLCPYYFEDQDGTVSFKGCLATIVPADKKKIHGMRDGILVPCV